MNRLSELRKALRRTPEGKRGLWHMLSIQRCGTCKLQIWARKSYERMGKITYCRDCWFDKTGRSIPEYIRPLNKEELSDIQEYYKLSGVKVSHVDIK